MTQYKERTEREWFVKGRARGDIRRAENERHAREMAGWNPGSDSVVLYRDVHCGPMVEVDQ